MNPIHRIDTRAAHELAFARGIVRTGHIASGDDNCTDEITTLEPFLFSAIRKGQLNGAVELLQQRIEEWSSRSNDTIQQPMLTALRAMHQQLRKQLA